MDIHSLRHLVTLSETENVRRAAALLRITPPALSKSIRLLEGELGYPLAVRSGRNIVLTDRARALSGRARELLADFERLRADDQAQPAGRMIRVVTSEVFSSSFLACLADLPEEGRRFILHEAGPGGIELAVQQGQADYGITYLPVPTAGLVFDRVVASDMGVYVRKGAFPGVRQPDLPFVVPVSPLYGASTRQRGLDGWPDDAYPRRVAYRVTLLESSLELVRNGWCAGYFPKFVAEAHNRRMKSEFQLERRLSPFGGRRCSVEVHLVRRESNPEDQLHRQLAKAIRMYCRGTPGGVL